MAKLIFPDCSVNSLACGQTVFCLVDLACRIDLFCADTLCDGSCRSDGVLAAKSNKTHLKRCHLRACQDSHCVSGTCVKWRIPHLMSGKSRIVRPVESCGSSGRTEYFFCPDLIGNGFLHRKTVCTVDRIVCHDIIRDIDTIQNRDIRQCPDRLCEQRFHVLAVDLDIPVTSGNISAILIL